MEKAEYDAMVENYLWQSDDARVDAELARYREALERIANEGDLYGIKAREALKPY